MILLKNINLPLNTDFEKLEECAALSLHVSTKKIKSVSLHRKSVDARKKSDVHFCCSLLVEVVSDEEKILSKNSTAELFPENNNSYEIFENFCANSMKNDSCLERPVIVGFGPAGMFAALCLAKAGLKPVVLERGRQIDQRIADVEHFQQTGELSEISNIQFGEGGAGTFSDGKLNTGTKDSRRFTVINTLFEFGADRSILYDAKPHIGTDVLRQVVKNIRDEIIANGGEIRFENKLCGFNENNGVLTSIIVSSNDGEYEMPCKQLILAIGHSARDTFKMLHSSGLVMESKPFSVGARIEHKQAQINKAQYGGFAEHDALPAADYKFSVHLENGRGVYTFCMCPGGVVVNASSELDGAVTNGMSNSNRDGENANSAILVGVDSKDYGVDSPLCGMHFQEKIEKAAYKLSGGRGVICESVGDFISGKTGSAKADVESSAMPTPFFGSIAKIFPPEIVDSMRKGILEMNKKMYGFANPGALLTAPETRSSSPVRITRNEKFQGSITGVYPCGEGAGYAGGIMSSAVDGIRVAEGILDVLI